ncbi:hypothetical protein RI367_000082 [Sorochytrium milnesiophthora]
MTTPSYKTIGSRYVVAEHIELSRDAAGVAFLGMDKHDDSFVSLTVKRRKGSTAVIQGQVSQDGCPELDIIVLPHAAKTLDSLMDQTLDRLVCLSIMTQLATAVQQLHAAKTIHGAIHPGNIVVDHTGRLFLVNFASQGARHVPPTYRYPLARNTDLVSYLDEWWTVGAIFLMLWLKRDTAATLCPSQWKTALSQLRRGRTNVSIGGQTVPDAAQRFFIVWYSAKCGVLRQPFDTPGLFKSLRHLCDQPDKMAAAMSKMLIAPQPQVDEADRQRHAPRVVVVDAGSQSMAAQLYNGAMRRAALAEAQRAKEECERAARLAAQQPVPPPLPDIRTFTTYLPHELRLFRQISCAFAHSQPVCTSARHARAVHNECPLATVVDALPQHLSWAPSGVPAPSPAAHVQDQATMTDLSGVTSNAAASNLAIAETDSQDVSACTAVVLYREPCLSLEVRRTRSLHVRWPRTSEQVLLGPRVAGAAACVCTGGHRQVSALWYAPLTAMAHQRLLMCYGVADTEQITSRHVVNSRCNEQPAEDTATWSWRSALAADVQQACRALREAVVAERLGGDLQESSNVVAAIQQSRLAQLPSSRRRQQQQHANHIKRVMSTLPLWRPRFPVKWPLYGTSCSI